MSAFRGADLVYSGTVALPAAATYAALNLTNVDRVEFRSNGQYNIAFDDLYLEAGSTVTPEPVSMALLGTGLAGLGAVRRRRRKREPAG